MNSPLQNVPSELRISPCGHLLLGDPLAINADTLKLNFSFGIS